MKNKIDSLYIHIPFCSHICHYCDFTKLFYNHKFSEPYLRALFDEIDYYHIDKVSTIYIGGGTPTSLCDEEFESLLKKVSPYLKDNGEFSVEANVENLTEKKLQLMKDNKVNRLSIGIESTDNKLLKAIGRNHTYEDAIKVVELAKQYIPNINVDLMYGFPHQSEEDLRRDIKNILSLDVDHISIYSLIVSEGTLFFKNGVKEQNQDDSRLYYDIILEELRDHGYERYEVSNFARNGKYSRHNLTYWHANEYYGVGLGASGYVNKVRYTNTKSLPKYLDHQFIDESETPTKEQLIEEYLLCHFRLEKGFERADFKERFGVDFADKFAKKIEKYTPNLILIDENNVRLSDDGLAIMDHILVDILG